MMTSPSDPIACGIREIIDSATTMVSRMSLRGANRYPFGAAAANARSSARDGFEMVKQPSACRDARRWCLRMWNGRVGIGDDGQARFRPADLDDGQAHGRRRPPSVWKAWIVRHVNALQLVRDPKPDSFSVSEWIITWTS